MNSHLIQNKMKTKIIHLMLIDSQNQVADLFTKHFHLAPFSSLVQNVRIMDTHSNLKGGFHFFVLINMY